VVTLSARTASRAIGSVFVVLGGAGFVPGLTSDYAALGVAGHGSDALALHVFRTSILLNVVRLVLGIAGIAAARTTSDARGYLRAAGGVCLVLFVYGLAFHGDSTANWLPQNWADVVLDLLAGAAATAASTIGRWRAATTSAA
jgi:Domain of unknown function (DUF4383)